MIDFAPVAGFNFLYPILFGLKKGIEKSTRTYQRHTLSAVTAEFEKNGFTLKAQRNQFFFPIVLHRLLKNPKISRAAEGLCSKLGLTAWIGSPSIAVFERK